MKIHFLRDAAVVRITEKVGYMVPPVEINNLWGYYICTRYVWVTRKACNFYHRTAMQIKGVKFVELLVL